MPRRQLLFVVPQKVTKKGTKEGQSLRASACPPWIPHYSTGLGAWEKPLRTGIHAHSTEHNSDVSAFRMEQPSPMPGKVPSAARRKRSETAAAEILQPATRIFHTPPLVPFLVTFCGTTKSNCPRGMSANSKKKKISDFPDKTGSSKNELWNNKKNSCPLAA